VDLVLPYMNQAFIVLSAICIAIGWVFIRRRNVEAHRKMMVTGAILAALFFISYVTKTIVIGDTTFSGPKSVKAPYQIFLQTHSILATVGGILGLITLWAAYKANFGFHRKIGPWTAIIWFISAASGVTVFLLLYVIYPPGTPTNIFRAWLGH
jgi:putative membrane protein